jgi:hypothetical protein
MEHFDRRGIEAYMAKHNHYSTLEAKEIVRQGEDIERGMLPAKLFGNPLERHRWIKYHVYPRLHAKWLFRFLFMYVFRLGFLDGLTGFRFCLFISAYEMLVALKIIEIKQQDRANEAASGPMELPAAEREEIVAPEEVANAP